METNCFKYQETYTLVALPIGKYSKKTQYVLTLSYFIQFLNVHTDSEEELSWHERRWKRKADLKKFF